MKQTIVFIKLKSLCFIAVRFRKVGNGFWEAKEFRERNEFVCETEVLGGEPMCVINTKNYAVVEKDAYLLSVENDPEIEVHEVDLYEGSTPLTKSDLTFTMSSTRSGDYSASNCNNDDISDECMSADIDMSAFLIIATSETTNFDKVKIYRGGATLEGATIAFYHRSTRVYNNTFGSDSNDYTFENWNGGVFYPIVF